MHEAERVWVQSGHAAFDNPRLIKIEAQAVRSTPNLPLWHLPALPEQVLLDAEHVPVVHVVHVLQLAVPGVQLQPRVAHDVQQALPVRAQDAGPVGHGSPGG